MVVTERGAHAHCHIELDMGRFLRETKEAWAISNIRSLNGIIPYFFRRYFSMNAIEWLVGLAKELDKNNLQDAAGAIRKAIGDEGDGGLAKVIGDYGSQNQIDPGGELILPLKVIIGGQEMPVKIKLDNSDPLTNAIILGGVLTVFLAQA